jgi:transcriptional regulator NrdR family protein
MQEPTNPLNPTTHVGLRCRKCGERQFRVIYTRGTRDGRVVRRRECRACQARITTREQVVGERIE